MQETQKEFKDFTVSPSELQDVQFFRYRKGHGRLLEYIVFKLPNGDEAQIHDVTGKNQFVSRMGLKISELRRIWDYTERNQKLGLACVHRSDPIVIRAVRENGTWFAYAVVTEKFTEVKHYEVWKIVEEELEKKAMAIDEIHEFRTNRRVWKTYLLESRRGEKVGDIVQIGLRVCNSIKGTSSVIIYPFWKRLSCMNGMTSSEGVWKPATTHTGEKMDILASVRTTLQEALDQAFGIEQLMAHAMKVKIEQDKKVQLLEMVAFRKSFSQTAKYYMKIQINREHNTLWGFVNALTYVSSHQKFSENVKLRIEQVAHSLLRGGDKLVEEYLNPTDPVEQSILKGVR